MNEEMADKQLLLTQESWDCAKSEAGHSKAAELLTLYVDVSDDAPTDIKERVEATFGCINGNKVHWQRLVLGDDEGCRKNRFREERLAAEDKEG